VFLWGFVPTAALVGLMWLSGSWAVEGIGAVILIAVNPLAILVLLIGQDLSWRWHGLAIEHAALIAESAFWWYVVAGSVEAIKRRRARAA